MNIASYFQGQYSLAYLQRALQVSANLMEETPFYLKLKFSVEELKKLR